MKFIALNDAGSCHRLNATDRRQLRALDHARKHMINIEKLSDADLDSLEQQFARLRAKHREAGEKEAAAD